MSLSLSFFLRISSLLVSFFYCSCWSFIICFPIINFLLLHPPFSFTYTNFSLHSISLFLFLSSSPSSSNLSSPTFLHLPPLPFSQFGISTIYNPSMSTTGLFSRRLVLPMKLHHQSSFTFSTVSLSLSLSACSNVFKQWDAFLQITFRKFFLVKILCLKQQFRALKTENEWRTAD